MAPVDSWTVRDSLRERYRHATGEPIEYDIRPYLSTVEAIDAVALTDVSDEALRARAQDVGERARGAQSLDALLPEVFAIAREASSRLLEMRPFDVQLAAGVAMHKGRLVQLATGEGKTLVAVPPAILNALAGTRVHIFTANDYLARRDAQWMAPLYECFGLRVSHVIEGLASHERRDAYAADVTYVTAKEAGFDFLRDHTALDPSALVHCGHQMAIVDEADCILIDEARVPLVIAGPAPAMPIEHQRLAALVRNLRRGVDYDADEYSRTVILTERGFQSGGTALGVALDDPSQQLLLSAVHVALHAETLLKRDRDYVVRDGVVELVDEWTGRVADNRRWPNGIQPAVEAKEGVPIRVEGRILGSIPMQHFIREYQRLAGMTATAESAADEFESFFGLTTVVFPPHRTCGRRDDPDVVFTGKNARNSALVAEIIRIHATGRPVLVGTVSVRESEDLAAALRYRGIACDVLNAKQDAHEAQIIARAGAPGAVTISTNMAGRGTDIRLGGDVVDNAVHRQVVALGGLYVIGTNRHESLRIDYQLRGRAGRQGDPGSSRFFISLEDDLIQRYGVMGLIPKHHRPAPQADPITDPIVSREIARAQRIVEGQNFEIRKTLWKYSTVVDDQRAILYRWRQEILRGELTDGWWATQAPDARAKLVAQAGEDAVRHAEAQVTMSLIDREWSEHLALIEDIREGIHLQRYGGKEPLSEFHRQVVEAFDAMMERIKDESVSVLERLEVRDGVIDLAAAGVAGSSSTWTYLINDNPFSTLGLSMMASRNIGAAATTGFIAMMYLPVSMMLTAALFVRRWMKKKKKR